MKINFVIPSTVLGGGIRVVFIYANYLAEKGHDVCVYVPGLFWWRKNGIFYLRTSIANSFIRRNKAAWFDNKFKIKVTPVIATPFVRDADVTIATAWYTAQNVYDLSPAKGIKAYFIQDYEIWNQDKNQVDRSYKLDMCRICITNSLRDTIKDNCNVDSEVVYNGHSEKEYITKKKVLNSPKTLIMLGNFANYKGGTEGLQIMEHMHSKYGCRCIIYGLFKPDFIPDFVEFYVQPERQALMSLYEQSDICIFPSHNEAWGLTVIEAMANKVAVVGYNTGCLHDVCTNEVNAIIVDNINVDELERAVDSLIFDDDKLVRIQDAGHELAKSFSWDKSAERFEHILIQEVEKSVH